MLIIPTMDTTPITGRSRARPDRGQPDAGPGVEPAVQELQLGCAWWELEEAEGGAEQQAATIVRHRRPSMVHRGRHELGHPPEFKRLAQDSEETFAYDHLS